MSGGEAITFGQFAVLGVLLSVARLAGLQLAKDLKTAHGPAQFTIRDMLGWTTALAIILGAMRYMPNLPLYRQVPEPVTVFATSTLVAGAVLYCSLGSRWLLARISVIPSAISVEAYLMPLTIRDPAWFFAFLLGVMAAWLLSSLLPGSARRLSPCVAVVVQSPRFRRHSA